MFCANPVTFKIFWGLLGHIKYQNTLFTGRTPVATLVKWKWNCTM